MVSLTPLEVSMKSMIFAVALFLNANVAMALSEVPDCAAQAESYVTGAGWTHPAVLQYVTHEGVLVYEVRTTQDAGDGAYEVLVDESCRLISVRNLWSE